MIALKRAFNWACEGGKLPKNPLKSYKEPAARSRTRCLTPEERQKIFDNYPEGDSFRDFLFALDNTACRPGEVAMVTAAQPAERPLPGSLDEEIEQGDGVAYAVLRIVGHGGREWVEVSSPVKVA